MTAIAAVCTPEGFVIGADGRQTNLAGTITSDKEQKIFGAEAEDIRVAYGFAGIVNGARFDLGNESKYASQEISGKKFSSVTEYSLKFAKVLYGRLVYSTQNLRLPDGIDYFACGIFVGYKGIEGEMISIKFPYLNGMLQKPILKCALEDPSAYFMMIGGHTSVYSAMREQGMMLPCKTTNEGFTLVEAFIGNCADHSDKFGNGIGGHTHIAKITPSESTWIVPPKP